MLGFNTAGIILSNMIYVIVLFRSELCSILAGSARRPAANIDAVTYSPLNRDRCLDHEMD